MPLPGIGGRSAPGVPGGALPLSCGGVVWGHGGDSEGYENRNAVTEDGRAVTVAVTALPADMASAERVNAVLDTALCAGD